MSDDLGFRDNSLDDELGFSSRPVKPTVAGSPEVATSTVAAPSRAAATRKAVFAGYTAAQLLVAAALVLALVWAMWVTKTVTADKTQHIVKADLSRIVGDYVQAQARSATPPDQVQAQMRAFMVSLDSELQRRGAEGEVVLVGEAVLSKSVPDITADVAKAVYAAGVKVPAAATQGQMGAMMQGQVPSAPAIAPVETARMAPMAVAPNPFAEVPVPQPEAAPADPSVASAMVSSFGGSGGQ